MCVFNHKDLFRYGNGYRIPMCKDSPWSPTPKSYWREGGVWFYIYSGGLKLFLKLGLRFFSLDMWKLDKEPKTISKAQKIGKASQTK